MCLSGSYGFILILCGPRPQVISKSLSCCGHDSHHLAVAIDDENHVVIASLPPALLLAGSHVAPNPSSLPVALPRDGLSRAYGVHGFAPAGSGSSPRCAIQMRSGVSAYTAPTDPQVQPSCLTPSGPSGRGCGQFGRARTDRTLPARPSPGAMSLPRPAR